jgi:sec-independent protein translocase protein TatB
MAHATEVAHIRRIWNYHPACGSVPWRTKRVRGANLMLLDFGWSELMLIGLVALVVIGPKDLPKALRIAGFWVRKARTMSREFQSSVEQMVREAELDEMRQELNKATQIDLDTEFRHTVDPTGSFAESLKPPELSDFSGPPMSAADSGGSDATEASKTEAEPAAPPNTPSASSDPAIVPYKP